MDTLAGKTALVTGGGKGIGKAIVEALAGSGACVVFTYKSSADAAMALATEMTEKGGKVFAFQSDATSAQDSAAIVENVVKAHGRLDILVNNAGITRDGLLMRMSEADWDAVIANNLKSVFNFTKAACRPMMGQRSGKIINITSVVGVTGNAGRDSLLATPSRLASNGTDSSHPSVARGKIGAFISIAGINLVQSKMRRR